MAPRSRAMALALVLLVAAPRFAHSGAAAPDLASPGTAVSAAPESGNAAGDASRPAPAAPDTLGSASPDWSEFLQFAPTPDDSAARASKIRPEDEEGSWLRAPFGDGLLTGIEPWHSMEHRHQDFDFLADYNRVDPMRAGFGWRLHSAEPYMPRLGARIERAFGRNRTLYGAQFEQPVVAHGRIALGAVITRRTDHNDLQQLSDIENSLSMLLSRYDFRDYFEREGVSAYVAWRVPDFSTVSVHVRTDQYRSLAVSDRAQSLFHDNRPLRDNPAIDEGEAHALMLRLERPTRLTSRVRAGLYHWIEIERAGHGLGGDFEYTRALADLRSVVRLSPAVTLSLRFAGGHTFDGVLTKQKEFTLGGPDALRAHAVDTYRGNRVALAQAEYDVGLWRFRSHSMAGGLHALAFVDVGRAVSETLLEPALDLLAPHSRDSSSTRRAAADSGMGVRGSRDRDAGDRDAGSRT
ncbi:MAG: hypothetical protein HYR73_01665 [Candidatus Eisenbacteria bacterium]|nr:hypothetical protein [Candidatus Eisenbacteria bacterium]